MSAGRVTCTLRHTGRFYLGLERGHLLHIEELLLRDLDDEALRKTSDVPLDNPTKDVLRAITRLRGKGELP